MNTLPVLAAVVVVALWSGVARGVGGAPPLPSSPAVPEVRPAGLSVEAHQGLQEGVQRLRGRMAGLGSQDPDRLADVELFAKGIVWALRYETNLSAGDVGLIRQALVRSGQRVDALAAGQASWTAKHGKVLRGFTSAVDGSTQPYGVIVPASYDGTRPMRLDVVLHGSSKPVGMSELRFGARFDEGDGERKSTADADYIELHPLGRVENCYRWAGETDVFEAIEATARNYRIDRSRIVLRGMSMGASGTWHLGLKHPDRFVAIGPYCGYVDTHHFSETPIPGFIKVGPLPRVQELGLHLLDSVDYAANAGVVPAIAAIGDQDVFFQAHVLMGQALAREGLPMVNLISPGTGHVVDPATHAEQMRRLGEYAAKGLDTSPRQLRFVTWSLKYNRCHWLEILGLQEHYARAEFVATVADDGSVDVSLARNLTRFALHPPALNLPGARMRIAGQEVHLPQRRVDPTPEAMVFALDKGVWKWVGSGGAALRFGKRPGLQGPMDDAFGAPFLCVRGTGRPWHPAVGAAAAAGLQRFALEWARYLRGDLPIKDDTEVTDDDLRNRHLILFGDPGSNRWIRQALPQLPLVWTRESVRLGAARFGAKDHLPALICPNPLPGAGAHYLVLNSGHTFHEAEFAAFNYLLFPHLGDWAVTHVPLDGGSGRPEVVVQTGYFDESWRLPTRLKP